LAQALIGVTTYRNKNQQGYPQICVNEDYTRALSLAGAMPVMVPLGLPAEQLQVLLSRLDGLMLSGGGDVAPERYGNPKHRLVSGVDADRDRIELYLLEQALHRRLPFLGICRGLQMINVGMGGTLYEDIHEQRPGSIQHQYGTVQPRPYLAHTVQVQPGSQLEKILGVAETGVNSLHHQAIRNLAPGLSASASAPDGVIEAIELADYPFGMGVQWHPESLQKHAPMRALFQAFVQACEQAA
jgi:putative glutamine amidotransferase